MSKAPVLLVRGTPAWERREQDRRAAGCRCISVGSIPHAEVSRSASIHDARRAPTPARLAWLTEEQRRRLDNEPSQLEDSEMAA
jgi:hypothetical protein